MSHGPVSDDTCNKSTFNIIESKHWSHDESPNTVDESGLIHGNVLIDMTILYYNRLFGGLKQLASSCDYFHTDTDMGNMTIL